MLSIRPSNIGSGRDAAARGGEGVRVEIKDLPGSSGHAQEPLDTICRFP